MENLRCARLRERLQENKLDGYLTFDTSDVLYLSGMPSEGCFVLVSREGDYIFAPLLLAEHARAVAGKSMTVVDDRRLLKAMAAIMKKKGLKKIGYDPDKVQVGLFKALESIPKVSWVGIGGFILSQRMFKDNNEIDAITQACRLTARSAKKCYEMLEAGLTEQETSFRLERLFQDGGSLKPAFETIIAFGENAAYPHHVVTPRKLRSGDSVLMDCGSSIKGYKSDLTRTAGFGKMSPKYQKIYRIVQESQSAGIAAVRDGVTAGKVDFVCREYIRKAGYGDYFVHGTGHGVGLDIHEPPRLGIAVKDILKEGMVVTVEPGIYLPGEFGVRIEDTVLVTKGGCKILTQA
ncbi:MAG: hypothetical protein A2901_09265 [Elusimicrobia bacterium RIFCSPLOWO2_01_FULL_54_10]|nr:MAG: hypothetical protein A2901_09265 [Elusimicrobia bacterium RIFCSPLOWO2_01_FULL_54_10]